MTEGQGSKHKKIVEKKFCLPEKRVSETLDSFGYAVQIIQKPGRKMEPVPSSTWFKTVVPTIRQTSIIGPMLNATHEIKQIIPCQ